VWDTVTAFQGAMETTGSFASRRAAQAHAWMWTEVSETLLAALRDDPRLGRMLPELERRVSAGDLAPGAAARQLVAAFRSEINP